MVGSPEPAGYVSTEINVPSDPRLYWWRRSAIRPASASFGWEAPGPGMTAGCGNPVDGNARQLRARYGTGIASKTGTALGFSSAAAGIEFGRGKLR